MRVFFIFLLVITSAQAADKLVIAHRGASGYLPEQSIAALSMAHAQGADLIEIDLVMTSDNRLVVLHDLYLNQLSNVSAIYDDRGRRNGRNYVVDFTLEELRSLEFSERFDEEGAIYPDRFPINTSSFEIFTLEEAIELIQGLNKSTDRDTGLLLEIKQSEFHFEEDKDIAYETLKVLKHYGYLKKNDKIIVQDFDFKSLKRIHDVLFPALGMDLKLNQLLDDSEQYNWMRQPEGMALLSQFVDGIAPHMGIVVNESSTKDNIIISPLVEMAHAAGLWVHVFTFRADEGMIPAYADDFEDLLDIFWNNAGIEGAITDFADRAIKFRDNTK